MPTSVDNFQARRVVTGTDEKGRSGVAVDELAPTRAATPTFTVVDLWQTDTVPPRVDAEDTLTGIVALDPPKAGVLVRFVTFPPDAEWQNNGGYEDAMAAIGGADSHVDDGDTAGVHATDTVDVVTVVEGEIYAVLENEEVHLRVGDTIVQRGTKHAWSNRTSGPATIVATMYSATR
jgi:mannose-6-phosphate isomerase-like protein (cupin superfamily)